MIFLFCWSFCSAQESYNLLSLSSDLTQYANSVLLDENIEIDASNIKKMKIKTRRAVAVLNELGAQDARAYEYYNENSKVKKISAEIYDGLGKLKKRYKKKEFRDVSRSGGSMYEDSRVLYLNYTPTFYPYIMVFESEVESGDSGLLSSHWFLQGYSESLLKSKMKIRFGADNKIFYKGKNLEGYTIQIEENPQELILTAENIPALRYEEYSPSDDDVFPHVLLAFNKFQLKNVMAEVDDWETFGAWMEKTLLGDVNQVSSSTIQKINELIEGEKTNEAKARKIYQFVQDKVRYVSIQIGIGGWKPMPAYEVDKLSYGDCKALTNYTKVLLDAVDIPSYYTIVYSGETKLDMDEDFASIQGNHVILGIPDADEITWLECTSQDLPFGYIGDFTDDRNVVAITPEGGKLIRTKAYDSEDNLQQTQVVVNLDTDATIHAEIVSISKGLQYQGKYFLAKQKDSDIDRFYKKRWNHIQGLSLLEFNFENNRDEIYFTENLSIQSSKYVRKVGNNFLLNPNMFNQMELSLPQIKDRKQNLKINRGFVDEDRIVYKISEEIEIGDLPETVQVENKFGKYSIGFTKLSENSFEYKRVFQLNQGEYPPEEYEVYREFIKEIARLDQTKILLQINR